MNLNAHDILRAENAQLRRDLERMAKANLNVENLEKSHNELVQLVCVLLHDRGGSIDVTPALVRETFRACLFKFRATATKEGGRRFFLTPLSPQQRLELAKAEADEADKERAENPKILDPDT